MAKIQDVVKQVAADGGDEVAEMTGWVRALKSNLPAQPSSAQEIARVRSFLQSDEDMVDLDEELGIAGPMLSALDELEQGTGGA